MRLKKGSRFYILGVLFFFLSSVSAVLAGIASISYGTEKTTDNPLLAYLGNLAAGKPPVIVFSFVLAVCATSFSFSVLKNGLRRNDLVLPFRLIGGTLILCSSAGGLLLILLCTKNGEPPPPEGCMQFLPFLCTGVMLFAAAANKSRSRMPAIFFGAMSCYAVFSEFGFEQIFLSKLDDLTDERLLGWSSLFLLALSAGFFFSAICFCVESCEYRPPKQASTSK